MKVLLVLIICSMLFAGCATMFYPSRLEKQPEGTEYIFDGGMCMLDLLFWGIFGFTYDCITGALWIPQPPEEE